MPAKYTFFSLLFSSTLVATPALSATPLLEDIAHNPSSGETYVLENVLGKASLVRISEDGDKSAQSLPSEEVTEIELLDNGQLLMIVNTNGYWAVTDGTRSVGGEGFAHDAHALPGNVLAVTTESGSSQASNVVLVAAESGNLAVSDSISTKDVEIAMDSEVYETTSGLGFAAGLQSAIGLAYRKHFENKWGIQVAAGGFGNADRVDVNIGATVMRTLHKAQVVRFYALAGASAFYEGYSNWVAEAPCTVPEGEKDSCTREEAVTEWASSAMINVGLGLGIEFRLFKRVGLAFELPFTATFAIAGSEGSGFQSLYMIPNGSLIYYF
ncbi:MAG: hypothetical protein AAB425_13005 [Bdellovibrionota bacterium]